MEKWKWELPQVHVHVDVVAYLSSFNLVEGNCNCRPSKDMIALLTCTCTSFHTRFFHYGGEWIYFACEVHCSWTGEHWYGPPRKFHLDPLRLRLWIPRRLITEVLLHVEINLVKNQREISHLSPTTLLYETLTYMYIVNLLGLGKIIIAFLVTYWHVHVHVYCTCTCKYMWVHAVFFMHCVHCSFLAVHVQCTCTCTYYNFYVSMYMYVNSIEVLQ